MSNSERGSALMTPRTTVIAMNLPRLLGSALLPLLSISAHAQDGDYNPPPSGGTGPAASGSTGGYSNFVLFTNLAGHSTAEVPGVPGAHFLPGTGSVSFDRIYGSANGHWAITGLTDLASTEDEVLLVDGMTVARQGTQAPWAATGVNHEAFDRKLGVNSAGEVAAAIRTNVAPDEYIVVLSGGVWSVAASEGAATGLGSLPGTTWGAVLESAVLDESGAVGFSADSVLGTGSTTTDDLLVFGGNLLMQEGVTVPPGQLGAEFIENFDGDDFFVSADGTHWAVLGDLTGSSTLDDVLIVDGSVVLQEGVVVPGSGFADPIDQNGITATFLDPGGHWYARGDNAVTNQDWVVRDGVVVAAVGSSIDGSSAETWDDSVNLSCFFLHSGNGIGDYVVGGTTSHSDVWADAVIMKNGMTEVARQGDPIDLDGNGVLDDDAYIDTFGDDDVLLTDDGRLYLVVTIMDGAKTRIGQGLIMITTGTLGTSYCTSTINSTGGAATISAQGTLSSSANDLTLSATSVPDQVFLFFHGQSQLQIPFGNGFLCAGGGNVRLNPPVLASGGIAERVLDVPVEVGSVGTYNFQCWFRDPAAGGHAFNTSNGVSLTLLP